MAAEFKSHVLMRDEKGFVGVPFKRLLLAGVCSGLTYTAIRIVLPEWSIAATVLVAVLMLVMTGTRGGLPLWQRLIYRVRGSLLLAAAKSPHTLLGQVAQSLELPVELVQLNAAVVFAPPHQSEIELREWVTFSHAQDADGLILVDAPLEVE